MGIADLDIQLTIQLAHEQVPYFVESNHHTDRDLYGGHVAPRIGWLFDGDEVVANPVAPPGWHITHHPTKPAIMTTKGYMERDD